MAGLRRKAKPAAGPPPREGYGPPYTPGQTAKPVNPPATSYATTRTPLRARMGRLAQGLRVGAPVVIRTPDRKGETHVYSLGAVIMPPAPVARPVLSSLFQMAQVGPIVNVARNGFLYRAGVPTGIGLPGRGNPGLAFKAPQIGTSTSGGPAQTTGVRMGANPAFKRVQNVPKYTTQPKAYATKGQTT